MCKVRKIHLLAVNGLMWTAIGRHQIPDSLVEGK